MSEILGIPFILLDQRYVSRVSSTVQRLSAIYDRYCPTGKDDCAYSSAGVTAGIDLALGLPDEDHLDADGYLYILDRRDDLITTGGVNVYPAQVERVFEQHPLVRSAMAFGVPNDDLGQHIEAVFDMGDATRGAPSGWTRARVAVVTVMWNSNGSDRRWGNQRTRESSKRSASARGSTG